MPLSFKSRPIDAEIPVTFVTSAGDLGDSIARPASFIMSLAKRTLVGPKEENLWMAALTRHQ
jgi:hypothetical protein